MISCDEDYSVIPAIVGMSTYLNLQALGAPENTEFY